MQLTVVHRPAPSKVNPKKNSLKKLVWVFKKTDCLMKLSHRNVKFKDCHRIRNDCGGAEIRHVYIFSNVTIIIKWYLKASLIRVFSRL